MRSASFYSVLFWRGDYRCCFSEIRFAMNYTYYSIVIRHSKEPNTLRRRKKEVQNRKDLGERMIMYNNGLVDKSKNSAETHSGSSRTVNLEI